MKNSCIGLVKILGTMCLIGGAYGLYADALSFTWHISVSTWEELELGWVILIIAKKVSLICFGMALIIYYKKSLDIFSRPWIIFSFLILLTLIILINYFSYQPIFLAKTWFEIIALVFFLGAWVFYKIKYPEEFGLKS
jgi:hypothetical protein